MMLRPLSEREKQLFIITAACLFLYLNFTLVIKPLRGRLGELDGSVEDSQKFLNKNLKVMQRAAALDMSYAEYSDKFKQTNSNEQAMSSILTEIQSVAQEFNLQILEIKPKTVTKKNLFNEFSVTLTINSTFIDTLHFLHNLQDKLHFYNVAELEINKDMSQNSDKMKFRIILSKIMIP